MSAEPIRAELIRKLRAIYGSETIEHDAADLLEADAARIEWLESRFRLFVDNNSGDWTEGDLRGYARESLLGDTTK